MRRVMTTAEQQSQSNPSFGMLEKAPKLSSFRILDAVREGPNGNASPAGSLTSVRYTVALSPADGFSHDDTDGSFFNILVAETPTKRWLVAELGGCC